jgi:putative hydroxymethylpyrimidine transport system ATP-binding protein
MQASSILIQEATFSRNRIVYFEDLNFTLTSGQWTCLLGKSGVGKSTLLKMIADLIPHKARIQTADNQSLQGHMSYMAQRDLLMPWLTTLDNVLLGYRLRGEKTQHLKNQALRLLEQVGLEHKIQAYPQELSGGMRQRVSLARTLMENKPIVLMDEPFNALDVVTRLDIQNLAYTLLKGKTVLLVTHDPWEALRLGSEILIISGTPATLKQLTPPSMPLPREPMNPVLFPYYQKIINTLSGEPS